MNLADNLKKIRKDNNLSQEGLAEKLGVSRQSVSKWESGQAYPEMDKVLQICKLFDISIDELMHSDIKEVNEQKRNKLNFSKYIDDFFAYITKTVNMFMALKTKDKIKCIIEQVFVVCILLFGFELIGWVGQQIISNLFRVLPNNVYDVVFNIIDTIYRLLTLFIGIVIFLHIFKIRYLDYYEVVDKENFESKEGEEISKSYENVNNYENIQEKNLSAKKPEKIIIRDPNHSGDRFLNGLAKFIIIFIKIFAFCFLVTGIFTLLGLSLGLTLVFSFVKAHMFFWGSIISIMSLIIITLCILLILFNFIINRKSKKLFIAIVIAISIITLGIGGGIFAIGITNVKVVETLPANELITDKYELNMNDDLYFFGRYFAHDIEYTESDIDNILINVEHSKYAKTEYDITDNKVFVYTYLDDYKMLDLIKQTIKDLNNYEIKDYNNSKIYVYASKENIEKLKVNESDNYEHEAEIEEKFAYYENLIAEYEEKVADLNTKIDELAENE